MLLRWLVDNYVRDAATGKMRDVVSSTLRERLAVPPLSEASNENTSLVPSPQPPTPSPQPAEFIPCDILFIFALGIESGGLVDLLQGAETSKLRHGVERAGKLAGREVAIVECGVGAAAAARATAEAIKFYRPKWVVSAGFAGALVETLRKGHILMAHSVAVTSGQSLATGLKLDSQSLAAKPGLHVGRLLTVSEIIRRPEQRREFASSHQAIACDMETFAVAEVCQKQGVPLLAVRVISDAVDDELPPEIERLLAQKSLAGKLGAAAGALLKRFSAAKDLWKLREDALKASDRLAKFLVSMLSQLANDQ